MPATSATAPASKCGQMSPQLRLCPLSVFASKKAANSANIAAGNMLGMVKLVRSKIAAATRRAGRIATSRIETAMRVLRCSFVED